MERVDVLVIGAGVVGLACARALALRGFEVMVAERHLRVGSETSSRNSEVIHAGIYYPPASLKASLCVAGRRQLYAYCQQRNIGFQRCGKLLVATAADQVSKLDYLMWQGRENGVADMEWLDADAVRRLEPALECVAAISSPQTGIVDSHGLMVALQSDMEHAGGVIALGAEVVELHPADEGITVRLADPEGSEFSADRVVNAAGHGAPALAAATRGLASTQVPRACYAKGNYFGLQGRSPFSRLVYPMPEPGGTGIHLTLDLAGAARFGPDVEWIDTLDEAAWRVSESRSAIFYKEIRRYWPELPDGALVPAYAGVRPKLGGPELASDFIIAGPRTHGVKGLINLFGIESPGLTACLAIADHVAGLLP